jgi:Skp family chaperone for outer membrane proteins
MKKLSLLSLTALLLPAGLSAQAPAPSGGTAGGRVAVVDFQKAVTENAEGKKAQEKFIGELNKRQKEFEEKQKAMNDAQTKLQAGDKTLSDTAKADLAKQIDKFNTELQRMNDDAQKDLGDLQQQLFRPIAEKTQDVLKTYSAENGFAVVFDTSSQQGNSIVFADPVADITTEIIRRVDAAAPKTTAPAAAAPRPATPPAAAPKPAEPAKK